ncbi:MAG: ABC transporter ATP-binding protein [Acetobacteraceae bacterium]
MEQPTLLRLSGIETGYGAISVLKGIDLEVRAGEIVALLGSNGSGKTTTINAISGVIPLWSGRVEYNDRRVDGLHPSAIVKLGLVQCAEGRQLFPSLTVLENLKLGSYTHRLSAARMRSELERIWQLFPVLLERRQQLAGTLSGGQQQMLAIGRALMARPLLLIMDEPSLGLAPLLVSQLFNLIEQINQMGTTILLVEQNAVASLKIANRAYVLESGTIALSGDAKELLVDPRVREVYLGL